MLTEALPCEVRCAFCCEDRVEVGRSRWQDEKYQRDPTQPHASSERHIKSPSLHKEIASTSSASISIPASQGSPPGHPARGTHADESCQCARRHCFETCSVWSKVDAPPLGCVRVDGGVPLPCPPILDPRKCLSDAHVTTIEALPCHKHVSRD